ncbi:hypothetical protein NESM_000866900 [Novymonas esmeraldas]|uniref:Uncharacterized protein n=1 Tax=Novymonas esmeraldas TaxID=1808958 RepID=A0AAW0EXG9_9TRYP
MTVVYPSDDDQRALVSFTEFFARQESVQAVLRVTPKDAQTVGDACGCILDHLSRVRRLVLGSVPLDQSPDAQLPVAVNGGGGAACDVGSVYPQGVQHTSLMGYEITFSGSAGAAPPLLHHPTSFLGSQSDAVDLMTAELGSAKDALLSLNATCAYLWTTNVEELRRYIAQDETRQRMQQPKWERAQMRAASTEGAEAQGMPTSAPLTKPGTSDAPSPSRDEQHAPSEAEQGKDTGTVASPLEPLAEKVPPFRVLLLLDASLLPSQQAQRSFAKFIQACDSLLEWADSVEALLSGRDDVPKSGTFEVPTKRRVDPARVTSEPGPGGQVPTPARRPGTKTVRVLRYEIRDVSHIYDMFYQQAECFYLPEYALYDSRIKQRLLQPSYYYALRLLIEDITVEIVRLEHIAAARGDVVREDSRLSPFEAYQHGAFAPYPGAFGMGVGQISPGSHDRHSDTTGEPSKIVFRPPLSKFEFLRNTLRVFLSVCLNEDDRTGLKRYEEAYQALVTNARDAVSELQHLPKPPQSLFESVSRARFPNRGAGATGCPRYELVLVSHEGIAQEVASGKKVAWVVSAEERSRLRDGFDAYWELRDGVHSLKSSLDKDIRRKNETHRTRVHDACVAKEKDPVALMAIERERERQEAVLRARREKGGWLGAARASLRSLAGMAACKAEVQMEDLGIPTVPPRDDAGVELTNTSPYHAEKVLLQQSVHRLWSAVEAHGVHMEREYPGLFYRGEKQRWARRVGSIVEKANAVGVVFSP